MTIYLYSQQVTYLYTNFLQNNKLGVSYKPKSQLWLISIYVYLCSEIMKEMNDYDSQNVWHHNLNIIFVYYTNNTLFTNCRVVLQIIITDNKDCLWSSVSLFIKVRWTTILNFWYLHKDQAMLQ
jgi:hypothetical protein